MEDIEYVYDSGILTITKCNKLLTAARFKRVLKQVDTVKEVRIVDEIDRIPNHVFFNCRTIEKIVLPNSIKQIGESAFAYCVELKEINMPKSLKIIDSYAFIHCDLLSNIELPKGLDTIRRSAFHSCESLQEIIIPEGVETIPQHAFFSCIKLERVTLPEKIKKIEANAFNRCTKLKEINIPDTVVKIGAGAFKDCRKLTHIHLPLGLKELDDYAFQYCFRLQEIAIPEGIEKVPYRCFDTCKSLNKVDLPSSVRKIKKGAFNGCKSLGKIVLSKNIEEVGRDALPQKNCALILEGVNKKVFWTHEFKYLNNDLNWLYMRMPSYNKYNFYHKGEYVEFNSKDLLKKANDNNKINLLSEEDYIKLYLWDKKNKFIPNYNVIKYMPVEDIDLFYTNNNCNKWKNILDMVNIDKEEYRVALFKLCYMLGMFQQSGNKSDEALEYIKTNILEKLSLDSIKEKFYDLDVSNGYDSMYAEFFMKYYKDNEKFMYDQESDKDYLIDSHNNFDIVRTYYPNKVINTNREVDLLLPEHVISILKNKSYQKIEKGNEELAIMMGMYGYSQEQFEELQEWFDAAKYINDKELKLFIGKDSNDEGKIQYDLLEKDDPLTAVLGNITNCCQVIGQTGESCVKYGMTMPNSKFMTFSHNKTIVGQSWVWYDETTKVICLDNIEAPDKFYELIKNDENLKREFKDCLKRVADGFIKEMENHGLEVRSVTVGKGYNDISYLLKDMFEEVKEASSLCGYDKYSDSKEQYVIKKK